MVSRTMWTEALDEDGAGAGPDHPTDVIDTQPVEGEPAEATTEEEAAAAYRRRRIAAGLILAGVAILLFLLLGWWLAHRGGDSGSGAATAAQTGASGQPVGGTTGSGPGHGATAAGTGTTSLTDGGVPGGSGGTGGTGGSGGTSGTGAGNHAATGGGGGGGGGNGGGAHGGGSGGGGTGGGGTGGGGTGGGGTGTTADSPLVSAKVDAGVTNSGVNAGVDLGVATAPGGAVTSVVVTACAKTGSGLSNLLNVRATVTTANGYKATDVKLTGLNLLNLLNPVGLKVDLGNGPVSVPANATVKVGLCLGL